MNKLSAYEEGYLDGYQALVKRAGESREEKVKRLARSGTKASYIPGAALATMGAGTAVAAKASRSPGLYGPAAILGAMGGAATYGAKKLRKKPTGESVKANTKYLRSLSDKELDSVDRIAMKYK